MFVAALNLQDIQRAFRTKKHPHCGSIFGRKQKRQYLHTISSPSQREVVYDRASKALQDIETCLLPSYGGRRWKVHVTVTDPTTTSHNGTKKKIESPYFVFGSKGALELAAWPQILSKIPSPPKFPGYYSSSQSKELAKQQRKKQHKQEQQQQQPNSEGLNEISGDSEAPVGGGQSADLVDEDEEEEEEDDESPLVGVTEYEMELISDLQERDVTPISELAFKERWRVPLPNISIKWVSPLREIFNSRKSAWDHAVALCKQEVWLGKVLLGFDTVRNRPLPLSSRSGVVSSLPPKKVLEAGLMRFQRDGLWVVGQEEMWKEERDSEENYNNHQEPRVVPQSRPLSGLQFYIQCNRMQMQMRRQKELDQDAKSLACRKLEMGGECNGQEETLVPTKAAKFTLRQADNELRDTWKNLSLEEQQRWKDKSVHEFENNECHKDNVVSLDQSATAMTKTQGDAVGSPIHLTCEEGQESHAETARNIETTQISRIALPVTPEESSCVVDIEPSANPCKPTNAVIKNEGRVTPSSVEEEQSFGATTNTMRNDSNARKSVSTAQTIRKMTPPAARKLTTSKKTAPWTKWCLNTDQVQLCYEAGLDHYDTVIETVKARDLHRELQDGFDVLRERGRGRFDMELPAFDTDAFKFLTDLSVAPWMPVVRQILGKDVVLIHKGMFLSMPGAEAQPYHQDGVHLTTQTQRECHAVNVFVPLVDLTIKHGPTEFCLGTHILGQEEYKAKFAETPLVKAGTPILFDYRLGHKGLANNSGTCRPILYCTYAKRSLGKAEFRDKVNFSRSRYHRIGDLVSYRKNPSREERAEKRNQLQQEAVY